MERLPHFIIIGAMKSATTTLAAQLGSHPGITMSHPKEPCFFSEDSTYHKGFEWYSSLFAHAEEGDLLGEASTDYTKLPDFPDTIERLRELPDTLKFIYVMRHPIDRLISHYSHNWLTKQTSLKINRALRDEAEYVNYSLYAMQLAPYFDAFGKERILPVFFSRLLSHPQEEIDRISRFIGYNEPVHWNPNTHLNKSIDRSRANRLVYFLLRSPLACHLRRKYVPSSIRKFFRNIVSSENKTDLSKDVRAELVETFNEDLAILGRLLGVELNCDNFKEVTKNQQLDWVDSPTATQEQHAPVL